MGLTQGNARILRKGELVVKETPETMGRGVEKEMEKATEKAMEKERVEKRKKEEGQEGEKKRKNALEIWMLTGENSKKLVTRGNVKGGKTRKREGGSRGPADPP